MPFVLFYYSSFERSIKGLDPGQRKIVQRILTALEVYYSSHNNLSEAQKLEPRFFYKKLRKPYYEVGVEGRLRIIIEHEKSDCFAVLAGNHDQIRKFLGN